MGSPRSPKDAPVHIYILTDPETGDVRYVGKTVKSLQERLGNHIACSKRVKRRHVCTWVRSVVARGFAPQITLLETVKPGVCWQERESHWTAEFRRAGARLTNHTDGGEGWHGHTHSPETKAKIGAAHRGRVRSDAEKAKQSVAMKGRKLTSEHVEKVRATSLGRSPSEEVRAKMSVNRLANPVPQDGEKNGNAKLNWAIVAEIRASGLKPSEISRKYGISDSHAGQILSNKKWVV